MLSRNLILLLLAVLVAGVDSLAANEATSRRPNIVFLLTDDQNVRSLGCYGAPGVKTPNIDSLAADGVVFDRHYDVTAICMASRATIMTGLPEFAHGVNFGTGDDGRDGQMLPEHWAATYPMQLRAAGYRTAFAGKFGFTVADGSKSGRYPEQDFDAWGGGPGQTSYQTSKNQSMARYAKEYPHSTRSYGAFGRDFIRESAELGQPFCLSISFKAPHQPVQPDPLYNDVYAGAVFPKPANFGREHGLHFSEQSRQGRQYERFFSWHYADNYDEVMAKYYQLIYAVDVAVGMIREAIELAGVKDNTIVIFTSDNGYFCGAHGYGSKVLPYEEGSRVPLIVFDPTRKKAGDRCAAVTSSVDFLPTILEAAGIEPTSDSSVRYGASLLGLYDGSEEGGDRSAYLINVWGPRPVYSLAVITAGWKYVYWPFDGNGMKPTAELYDMQQDSLEMVNRIGEPAAKSGRVAMEARYDALVEVWRDSAIDREHYQSMVDFFERRE